jgi:hypothetical protein
MRVINFIRAQVAAGGDPLPALRRSGERPWQSDDHLTPVLPDDALLFHDWEEEAAAAAAAATAAPGVAQDAAKAPAGADAAALDALREENEALRNALCELTLEGAPGLRQLLLVRLDCRPEVARRHRHGVGGPCRKGAGGWADQGCCRLGASAAPVQAPRPVPQLTHQERLPSFQRLFT